MLFDQRKHNHFAICDHLIPFWWNIIRVSLQISNIYHIVHRISHTIPITISHFRCSKCSTTSHCYYLIKFVIEFQSFWRFYSIQLDRDCSSLIFVYQLLYTTPTILHSVHEKFGIYRSNLSIGILPLQFHLYLIIVNEEKKTKQKVDEAANNVMNQSRLNFILNRRLWMRKRNTIMERNIVSSERCHHCDVHQFFCCLIISHCNSCSADHKLLILWTRSAYLTCKKKHRVKLDTN